MEIVRFNTAVRFSSSVVPENNHTPSRRSVLKTVGASAVGLPVASASAAADQGLSDELEQARRVRRKTGDNDKFVKYLRKRDYAVESKAKTETISHSGSSDGDVGTQKLSESDLSVNLNIIAYHVNCNPDPYDIYVEYYFDWDVSDGFGEGDRDAFSIGWPSDEFQYAESSADTSSNVSFYDRDNSLNGISFKFDDGSLSGGDSVSGYGGCSVTKESGWSDSTTFAGKYVHTYDDLEICGFSVSSDGTMAYSYCQDGRRDNMGFVQTEYSERTDKYTNC